LEILRSCSEACRTSALTQDAGQVQVHCIVRDCKLRYCGARKPVTVTGPQTTPLQTSVGGWGLGALSTVVAKRSETKMRYGFFFSGLDSLPLTQGYVKRHFGFPLRDMEVTLLIIMVGQPPVISATASRSPLFSPSFSIFSSVISHNPYAFRNKHR